MNSTKQSAPSRREFLSAMAAAAAVPIVLGSRASAASAGATSPAAASGASVPTCVHVFSKPLQVFSYEETARLAAEAGYGGIDFSVRPNGHVLPQRVKEDLPRAVEAARAAGLKVEMITTGIVSAGEKYARDILETAAKLGVKYYRLGWVSYDHSIGVVNTLAKLKPVMRDLAELNKSLGLHGAYQNHSGVRVGGAGWDVYELIRDLDPQWFGCQFDIRHATAEGGQSWPVTLRLLRPWIRCTDIKDFHWVEAKGKGTPTTVALGDGIVDFKQYFTLVRELNITGPMSVHLEYPPFENGPQDLAAAEKRKLFLDAMRKDRETLRGFMSAAKIA